MAEEQVVGKDRDVGARVDVDIEVIGQVPHDRPLGLHVEDVVVDHDGWHIGAAVVGLWCGGGGGWGNGRPEAAPIHLPRAGSGEHDQRVHRDHELDGIDLGAGNGAHDGVRCLGGQGKVEVVVIAGLGEYQRLGTVLEAGEHLALLVVRRAAGVVAVGERVVVLRGRVAQVRQDVGIDERGADGRADEAKELPSVRCGADDLVLPINVVELRTRDRVPRDRNPVSRIGGHGAGHSGGCR